MSKMNIDEGETETVALDHVKSTRCGDELSRHVDVYLRSKDGEGLERQAAACARQARAMGLDVVQVHRDLGGSGLEAGGAGFKQLMLKVRAGQVRFVLVEDLDRI